MKGFTAALILLASSADAFAPMKNERVGVSLKAQADNGMQKVAFSAVAAAFVAANVAASPALAADNSLDMFGSSEVIAARSGGRGGGRVSSGGARSASRPSASYNSYRSTTTIVQPAASPTVVVAPPVTYGYGYNPLGGIATGYALGSIGNIGNEMRDIRQEGEIQRSKIELEQAKAKQAELEARLRNLEVTNAVQQATR